MSNWLLTEATMNNAELGISPTANYIIITIVILFLIVVILRKIYLRDRKIYI